MKKYTVSNLEEFISVIDNINTHLNEIIVVQKNDDPLDLFPQKIEICDSVCKYLKNFFKAYDAERMRGGIRGGYNRVFYRGQANAKWNMQSGVFRDDGNGEDYYDREDFFFHEIQVRCAGNLYGLSRFDKLVNMQHYQCPTRLLDITDNPLVALYFACMDYNSDGLQYDEGVKGCQSSDTIDGKVYVFIKYPFEVSYSDSDRVRLLTSLVRFDRDEKDKIFEISVNCLGEGCFPLNESGTGYKDDCIERLYYEVSTENPAFKRNIRPIDLLQPRFVVPNRTNDRIKRQEGAFIISGLSKNKYEEQLKFNICVDAEITIRNKQSILGQLDHIGINEATLFPEMDRVAWYLKYISSR